MKKKLFIVVISVCSVLTLSIIYGVNIFSATTFSNPTIKDTFTADPAAMVSNGTVYLYTGHDEASEGHEGYVMNDWRCYTSTDMINWKAHGEVLNVSAFSWSKGDAWASEIEERNGRYYFYVCTEHRTIPGKAIGVAVSDSPTGPFRDALGHALVTNDMTKATDISWDDIDPTCFIDNDGQAYLFWGNTACYYARLNSDMISISGSIQTISLPSFTEASYIHKRGNIYYLSYAYGWEERIAYATSNSINGPWTYRGIINDYVPNCNTNHQSIIEYNGSSYFIYHNGALPTGGSFRRSVCIDNLYYNSDGTIQPIIQTLGGTASTGTPTGNCGDVNSSGNVDITDALLIAQYYVGGNPANFNQGVADVNGDGNVSIQDALLVAQYYVGIIDTLSCN